MNQYGSLQQHEHDNCQRDIDERREEREREWADDVRLREILERVWRRERDRLITQVWGEGP